jgi:hypothetical protein
LLHYSNLRNLGKNNFCYNYTNILLQPTHFYSITATCEIESPNRTRVSTWGLESFQPGGLSSLANMERSQADLFPKITTAQIKSTQHGDLFPKYLPRQIKINTNTAVKIPKLWRN